VPETSHCNAAAMGSCTPYRRQTYRGSRSPWISLWNFRPCKDIMRSMYASTDSQRWPTSPPPRQRSLRKARWTCIYDMSSEPMDSRKTLSPTEDLNSLSSLREHYWNCWKSRAIDQVSSTWSQMDRQRGQTKRSNNICASIATTIRTTGTNSSR
jgi:hypothetical protein